MVEGAQHTLQIMETQTRFDLNAAIAAWQQELGSQPDLTPVVRRELETHLRDTVAELQGRGLNNEESFWLARRRVGQPRQLGEEFAKGDPAKVGRERVLWMVLALLIFYLWGASINFLLTLVLGTGLLLANGFRLFFYWSPLVIGAVLIAKGRFGFASETWKSFLGSRFRLVAVLTIWMLFNAGGVAWYRMAGIHGPAGWYNLWGSLLSLTVWPSMLIGLLIWLMLREDSEPKSA